jgi:hypothetical protein
MFMKKMFVLMLAVFFSAAHVTAQTADIGWYTGDPGAASFTVSTADELAGLALIVNGAAEGVARDGFSGKTVRLTQSIDLSKYDNWMPIGNYGAEARDNIFSGTFDGGGHVISGLVIDRPDADYQGLFGCVDSGGRVENLGVEGVSVRAGWWVGGLAGYVGSGSRLVNSYTGGEVIGNSAVGGLAGVLCGGRVDNSYSTASVSSNRRADSAIDDRLGIMTAHLGGEYAGGVAGLIFDNGGVANSYSTGAVSGVRWVGGVAGYVFDNSSVSNSYSTGAVSGRDRVGGVAGGIIMGSGVTHCAALNPEVKSTGADVGRVVGYVEDIAPGTLLNNAAWAKMKNGAGNAKWKNKGPKGRGGANISASAIKNGRTVGHRFISTAGWATAPGSLPGLRGAPIEIPGHLKR